MLVLGFALSARRWKTRRQTRQEDCLELKALRLGVRTDLYILRGSSVVLSETLRGYPSLTESVDDGTAGEVIAAEHRGVADPDLVSIRRIAELLDEARALSGDSGVKGQNRPDAVADRRRFQLTALKNFIEVDDAFVTRHRQRSREDLAGVSVVDPQHGCTTPYLDACLPQRETAGIDALGAVADEEQPVRAGRGNPN